MAYLIGNKYSLKKEILAHTLQEEQVLRKFRSQT